MRAGKNKGFTLVEMIVAVVIAASLGTAVYATFAQGVRLWTRTSVDRGEWKVDLWVEKMTGDLRNAFRDPQWAFKGSKTEISFATLAAGRGMKAAPEYFHYAFDPQSQTVMEQKYSFENILMRDASKGVSKILLEKILAFDLEYYSYDPKVKAYRWSSQWNKDCLPKTVKITIEPERMNHRKWTRMIQVPAESACPV